MDCEFGKHFTQEGISLVERGFKMDLLVTGEITNLYIKFLNYILSYKTVPVMSETSVFLSDSPSRQV